MGVCQAMQHIKFDILENFLSPERLSTYLRLADGNKEKATDLYMENLNQCQVFHTRLHWLEIGVRNAMNRELSKTFGKAWHDNPKVILGDIERNQIAKAKENLAKDNKPIHNPDIIAALNFGLWVNLYNKPYEELWRKCLFRAFAHNPAQLTRKQIREKLHPILRLRNRIAHYEPILGYSLPKMKQDIIDIVQWIEPSITEFPISGKDVF